MAGSCATRHRPAHLVEHRASRLVHGICLWLDLWVEGTLLPIRVDELKIVFIPHKASRSFRIAAT